MCSCRVSSKSGEMLVGAPVLPPGSRPEHLEIDNMFFSCFCIPAAGSPAQPSHESDHPSVPPLPVLCLPSSPAAQTTVATAATEIKWVVRAWVLSSADLEGLVLSEASCGMASREKG